MPEGCFSANLDNLSTSETESIAPRAETLGRVVGLLRFNLKAQERASQEAFESLSHPLPPSRQPLTYKGPF